MNFKALLLWYEHNQRDLIFRKTKAPYHIWISEIMLQQTQVDTVLPYFVRFLERYPTIVDLANASMEELLKTVEGLGYYRRFKNMHKAAQVIVDQYDGAFPHTYEQLLKLPGVGAYTAGAIMSICYDQPYSAVDGNVIRVLSRYEMLDDDMRLDKNKKKVNVINQQLIEQTKPSAYTQAMMELGALVCKPLQPKCDLCPLAQGCKAHQHGVEQAYPKLSKLKDKKMVSYTTFVIEHPDGIILRKRTESLLEGMYEYPQLESESLSYAIDTLSEQGVSIDVMGEPMYHEHVFTHMVWQMTIYHARHIEGMLDDWSIVKRSEVKDKPMAIAHRKIKK